MAHVLTLTLPPHCSYDAQNLRSLLPDIFGFCFYGPKEPNNFSLPHAILKESDFPPTTYPPLSSSYSLPLTFRLSGYNHHVSKGTFLLRLFLIKVGRKERNMPNTYYRKEIVCMFIGMIVLMVQIFLSGNIGN